MSSAGLKHNTYLDCGKRRPGKRPKRDPPFTFASAFRAVCKAFSSSTKKRCDRDHDPRMAEDICGDRSEVYVLVRAASNSQAVRSIIEACLV